MAACWAASAVMPLAPCTMRVSASAMPSFLATFAPATPNAPVAAPAPKASADWPAVSSPSLVSWRICSAVEPAAATPSPAPAATAAPSLGAAAITPRPIRPPAPITGNDSATALEISDGFDRAYPALPITPSACSNSFFCCWVASVFRVSRNSRACFGRKPTAPSLFSRNLPTAPPVGMSARPTAISGTPMAPCSAEIPRSRAWPAKPLGSGLVSPPKSSHGFSDCPPDGDLPAGAKSSHGLLLSAAITPSPNWIDRPDCRP